VDSRVSTYLMETLVAQSIGAREEGYSLKCSVDFRMQEKEDEKPTAISGLECCELLQVRKRWDSVFKIAEPLVEQDLASEACRDCVRFCLFGVIAMLVAHYLFWGALEVKGRGDGKSLCVVMVGLSLLLRIMGVGVVVCLCTWGFFRVVWKPKRTCSCCQDLEQRRTWADDTDERAQKAQCSKHLMNGVLHSIRDCRSACIIRDDLHAASQIEARSHALRTVKSESSFMTQDSSSPRRVLLVEDTEINRIILRKVLQTLNLHCEEAENGKVAVDYFKQGRIYDLVFMDKEMPVMDGHEATRQLRSMGVKTPIVALTGNTLQSDKDLFFEAGVDDFQTKPLPRDKLVQLLARYGVKNCAGNRRG